jgi:F0F1-type ATP synthase assembly protein I
MSKTNNQQPSQKEVPSNSSSVSDSQKDKEKDSENQRTQQQWRQGMALFYRVSSWVVAPLILALLLGKWLDNRYQTEPWLLLGFTLVAFFVSMWKIIKESTEFIDRIEREATERKAENLPGSEQEEDWKRELKDDSEAKDNKKRSE